MLAASASLRANHNTSSTLSLFLLNNCTEYYLNPGGQRNNLAQYIVCRDDPLPDLAQEIALDVEPNLDAHTGLGEGHDHQSRRKHCEQNNKQDNAAREIRTPDLCIFVSLEEEPLQWPVGPELLQQQSCGVTLLCSCFQDTLMQRPSR